MSQPEKPEDSVSETDLTPASQEEADTPVVNSNEEDKPIPNLSWDFFDEYEPIVDLMSPPPSLKPFRLFQKPEDKEDKSNLSWANFDTDQPSILETSEYDQETHKPEKESNKEDKPSLSTADLNEDIDWDSIPKDLICPTLSEKVEEAVEISQENLTYEEDKLELSKPKPDLLTDEIGNARNEFADCFTPEELKTLENVFKMANAAQDGLLNKTELKFFLDLHDYVISDQEARQIIKHADLDGDCALSFREFLFLCKRADMFLKTQTFAKKSQPGGEGIFQGIKPNCDKGIKEIDEKEDGGQASLKIRKIFQAIFASIRFQPRVRETVEFFESKIAEGAKSFELQLSSPRTKKLEEGLEMNTNTNDESPPPEAAGIDKAKENINESLKCGGVEMPSGGDTKNIDDTEDMSKESINLEENWKDVEGAINQEMLRIQEEVAKADSSLPSPYDFDLIVLGGDAGGSAAAKEASKFGKRVAICDFILPSSLVKSWGWRFGGSCVNVNCVPKMLMHHSGLIGQYFDKKMSLPFGWFPTSEEESAGKKRNFNMDWSTLIDNIQSHIRTLNFERQFGLAFYKGIQYYNAYCEFDGPHRIILTHEDKRKEVITGERILIAVGSVYNYLEVPGAGGNCITVDDIFSLRNHPGKVLIVGGGPDAIECAGLLCNLNIDVTIMSRSPALKGFDRRMVTLILETLSSRGVKLMIGWSPIQIINSKHKVNSGPTTCRKLIVLVQHNATSERVTSVYNTIVLAIGKKPCTPLLKLDKADVLLDDKTSKIWVDSQDMTTAEEIFAIGECALERPAGTAISYQAGINLIKRLFAGSSQVTEYDQTLPKFLMTPVEYGCIGLSEEAAVVEHGEPNVQVYHSGFQPLQYQLAYRHKDTFYAKLITLKTENERIIGLHYLGPNAGEIIQGFTLGMKLKATKSDLDSMIGIHPTCAEIFSRMTNASSIGGETVC